MTSKAERARPQSRAASGRVKVPSPSGTPVPTKHASGAPVRPVFIRALLQEQKAFEKLASTMDKLRDSVVSASESGAPAPTLPPEGQKT